MERQTELQGQTYPQNKKCTPKRDNYEKHNQFQRSKIAY